MRARQASAYGYLPLGGVRPIRHTYTASGSPIKLLQRPLLTSNFVFVFASTTTSRFRGFSGRHPAFRRLDVNNDFAPQSELPEATELSRSEQPACRGPPLPRRVLARSGANRLSPSTLAYTVELRPPPPHNRPPTCLDSFCSVFRAGLTRMCIMIYIADLEDDVYLPFSSNPVTALRTRDILALLVESTAT